MLTCFSVIPHFVANKRLVSLSGYGLFRFSFSHRCRHRVACDSSLVGGRRAHERLTSDGLLTRGWNDTSVSGVHEVQLVDWPGWISADISHAEHRAVPLDRGRDCEGGSSTVSSRIATGIVSDCPGTRTIVADDAEASLTQSSHLRSSPGFVMFQS